MGDAPARTELKVTTGPIRGSRKVHIGDLKVAMRAVDLEPSSGEPPVVLYDTSGPYTDPAVRIDIMAGLAELTAATPNLKLGGADQFMQRFDANKDGKVTAAEYPKAALAAFDLVDTNKDGTLSAQEKQAARKTR